MNQFTQPLQKQEVKRLRATTIAIITKQGAIEESIGKNI